MQARRAGSALLAEAWQVLGDPGRRAAYDRALTRGPQSAPPLRITVRRHTGSGGRAA